MKMDSSIINREGVEKLLTMLPTEEEVSILGFVRCEFVVLVDCGLVTLNNGVMVDVRRWQSCQVDVDGIGTIVAEHVYFFFIGSFLCICKSANA